MSLTAIILNHLPAKLLKPTLKSVDFADEVIIIHDTGHSEPREVPRSSFTGKSRSPQATASLHASLDPSPEFRMTTNVQIFNKKLNSFADQRNFGLKKASHSWVLFLDSDEVVSKKLAKEIKKTIKTSNYQGYLLPRQDIILGTTLRHGETGQTKLLRLAKKSAGTYSRHVHETWNIRGRVGELKSPLMHLKKNFITDFIKKISRYGLLDSQELTKENKPFSCFKLLIYPPVKFSQNYIVRRGIQDGLLGLFHAYLMSIQSLSVRVFQWQNERIRP